LIFLLLLIIIVVIIIIEYPEAYLTASISIQHIYYEHKLKHKLH